MIYSLQSSSKHNTKEEKQIKNHANAIRSARLLTSSLPVGATLASLNIFNPLSKNEFILLHHEKALRVLEFFDDDGNVGIGMAFSRSFDQ